MVPQSLWKFSSVVWEGARCVGVGLCQMEEFASDFAAKFALTEDEQRELIVERGSAHSLQTTNFLLVGKLLTNKPFNGEALMRTMTALWRPKVKVQVGRLEENFFMFSFQTKEERLRILSGGPWSFNRFLLVLAVADDLVQPSRIPLVRQEFWVQVKGLPLVFMTKAMGKRIGEELGVFVVSDHGKRGAECGSYLRIRVGLDVTKPLRRCLPVRLSNCKGDTVWADIRYERLPNLCYLCGMFDHLERECRLFTGQLQDDMVKPYGRWFQEDFFAPDYRRPTGQRFGLLAKPWSMCAPEDVGEEEMAETVASTVGRQGEDQRADMTGLLLQKERFRSGAIIPQDDIMTDVDHSVGEGGVDVNFPLPDLNLRPLSQADCDGELAGAIIPFVSPNLGDQFLPFDSGQSSMFREEHITLQGGLSNFAPSLLSLAGSWDKDGKSHMGVGPTEYGNNSQCGGSATVDPSLDDPFGLGPIIQRIAHEAKGPHRRKTKRRKQGSRAQGRLPCGSDVNTNGKRGPQRLEGLEVSTEQKRRCMAPAYSAWQQRSVEADEDQPRRA